MRSAWNRFALWFDQTPVQLVYSALMFGAGIFIYVVEDELFWSIMVVVGATIHGLAILMREPSDD